MRTLKVNETKVTSPNAFIDNIFALESEKESKKEERILYLDHTGLLTLLLTVGMRRPHICGFLGCFGVSHFFVTLYCFWKLRPN